MRELIRHVRIDDYGLKVFDENELRPDGKHQLGANLYRLEDPSDVVFDCSDFGNSPLHAIDSDETIRAILTFLTLRPGDTDADYFKDYTPRQIEFTEHDAERLSIFTIEDDECEHLPFEELEHDDA